MEPKKPSNINLLVKKAEVSPQDISDDEIINSMNYYKSHRR